MYALSRGGIQGRVSGGLCACSSCSRSRFIAALLCRLLKTDFVSGMYQREATLLAYPEHAWGRQDCPVHLHFTDSKPPLFGRDCRCLVLVLKATRAAPYRNMNELETRRRVRVFERPPRVMAI